MMGTCSILDCGRPERSRGWCKRHYERWRKHGDPLAPKQRPGRNPRPPKPCAVKGCGRASRYGSQGYCNTHYSRWYRTDNPGPAHTRAYGRVVCSINGCNKPHRARDYCQAHYERWQKYGDSGPSTIWDRIKGGCSIQDCGLPHQARGWCAEHHYRWLRYGDPLFIPLAARSDDERLWARVNKHGARWGQHGYCWEWTASTTNGYGQARYGGTMRLVFHILYELMIGSVPRGLTLDHLCRNRLCVRPSHMEPVTLDENKRRGDSPAAVNARKTHCKRGHPLSGDNLYTNKKRGRCCRECTRQYQRDHPRRPRPLTVSVGKGHPLADKRGWALLHRLVWYEAHGPIPPGHFIHHKDGNALNNRLRNLVCVTRAEHNRLHAAERQAKQIAA